MVALCAARGFPWVEGTRILLRRQHRAGQPGLAGKTKCAILSVGKSDRAAREDVVLAQAALGHRRSLRCGVVDVLAAYDAKGPAPGRGAVPKEHTSRIVIPAPREACASL